MSDAFDQHLFEENPVELMDLLPIGVCIITENLAVCAWNDVLARWTGIERAEALEMNLGEKYPNLLEARYRERLQQVFSTGTPAVYTAAFHKHFLPVELHHGQSRELMIQQTQVRLLDDHPHHALVSIMDVTAQYQQLRELRREQTALRTAK